MAHGMGLLALQNFEPFPKNPSISKVFREIGIVDELGSGMRNTYKYTQLYSGQTPLFEEGDIFRTIIPLKKIATQKVGGGNVPQNVYRMFFKEIEDIIITMIKEDNRVIRKDIAMVFCNTQNQKVIRVKSNHLFCLN
ncbi:hypothetical protein [Veillonella sp.]